ncbi:putative NADP(+)-dependent dehydrogenase [Patellaria atrata CBS 101060]|uniref:NADP(+)-dependent dehydrogenase n=1 Tax=Patellaria atrata CBS 101060 TaxID=1346257 RepID=A0A9P4VLA3_9PEZI|nr:putative NADP(+)-dependent dehydrogenase [Patellaria atrata CBS 101060]
MLSSVKTAIITGSAQGVGFCIAKDLAKRGYKVVISDIDTEKGSQAATEVNKNHGDGTAVFIPCDLTRTEDIDNLLNSTVEKLGGFSVLVNNAGFLRAPFLAISPKDIQDTIGINLTAPIYATQQCIKLWNENPEQNGQVVTVTSSSSFKTYASISAYGAAKAGAAQFTFASRAFGPRIRINAVAPTAIATNFENNKMRVQTDKVGAGYTPEPEMRAMGLNRLQPEDVANGVVRCIEDDSMYGQVLYLDAIEGMKIHSSF